MLSESLEDLPENIRQNCWLQQNRTPVYFTLLVLGVAKVLQDFDLVVGPARSLDLTLV